MDADCTLLSEQFEDVFLSEHDIHLRSPFRILDLPPELWIRICEFAVTNPCGLPITVGREHRLKDQMALVQQPPITRSCRLLRIEALPIFYSANSFEVLHYYGVPCPRKWVSVLGKAGRLRHMKSLVLYSNCDMAFWLKSFQRAEMKVNIEYMGVSSYAISTHHSPMSAFKVAFE